MSIKSYLWSVLVAADQGINTVAGPVLNAAVRPKYRFGDPDETISSVLGKNARAGACRGCRWICRLLNRLDPSHCDKSIEADEGPK